MKIKRKRLKKKRYLTSEYIRGYKEGLEYATKTNKRLRKKYGL